MKNNISRSIWGIILVIVGLILGLHAVGVLENVNIFFDGWWTLFIIIPCAVGLFTDYDKTGNIIGLVIGVVLLLACQNVIHFELVWDLLVPTIIVIIGLKLIFGNLFAKKEFVDATFNDNNVYYATFAGQNINYDGKKFDGAKVTATFGGVKLDLRNAKVEDGAVIKANATFGGIDIFLDDDIKVEVKSSCMFGGVDVKKNHQEGKKTVYLDATSIFGGVEVK